MPFRVTNANLPAQSRKYHPEYHPEPAQMPLLTAPQVAQAGPPVARAAPMAASSMPVTGTGYALALETQPPHALAKAPPGPSPATGVERVEAGPLARTKAPPEGGPPERTTKAPPGPSPAAVQAAAEEPARGRFRGKRHTKAPPPQPLPKCEASEGVTNRWPKAAPYYQQSQVQSLVSRF